jgi:hypothetical protein
MFVVCCALFALSKMMTECAEERLQKFLLLLSNYVIPSEVEESLDVNLRPWRATTTFGSTSSQTGTILFSISESRIDSRGESGNTAKEIILALLPITDAQWYRDIRDAIARESQLKKWSRRKKVVLINRLNPGWRDLGADVLQET